MSRRRKSPAALTPGKETGTLWESGLGRHLGEKNVLHLPEFDNQNFSGGGPVNYRRSCSLNLVLLWREDRSVSNTDIHQLTTGIRSEKCVVRRFRRLCERATFFCFFNRSITMCLQRNVILNSLRQHNHFITEGKL